MDTHGSCIESAYGRNGVGLDTAEQVFQEVVELEYLIGRSRNVGALLVRVRVVANGVNTHAEVINDLQGHQCWMNNP